VLHVSVISPEKILFEGDVESVVAPAFDGEVGILTDHAAMMTLLGHGELRLGSGSSAASGNTANGARRFQVDGGFLQVANNTVRVVTEKASAI
jgi:ATP synthase F1 epsilon subunit